MGSQWGKKLFRLPAGSFAGERRGEKQEIRSKEWSRRVDLNHRPKDYETTLTHCLRSKSYRLITLAGEPTATE
jgi:hypothetical protein